jgi:D-amino-acid dehydrogenase
MRISIIGAGIVGVCTAAWLQRDGHEVIFIDPLDAGEGCSFGNAGSLSPSACLPVGMPGMWRHAPRWLIDPTGPLSIRWRHLPRVAPWLARMMRHSTRSEVVRIAGALRSLLEPIFDSYGPLLEHAGAQALVRRNGCLYVYSSRDVADRWKWGMDLRRRLGVRLIDIERDDLASLEPDLKGEFRFGLLAPDNGSTIDPSALVKAIHAQCMRDGAVHERQRVIGVSRRGDAVKEVLLSDGRGLAVDGVVLAGGAWSAPLAAKLGARLPLETQRGYHVTVQSSNLGLRHTVMAVEHNMMVNPMAMGLRLAGSVEFGGLTSPPNYARADALLHKAIALFPHLNTTRVTRWMGHRPCMPDSLPVIDRAPAACNAWLAFGHGHVGMCTGREIANLIGSRAPQIDLAPFSAKRFH